MLAASAIWTFLRSPFARYLGLVVGVSVGVVWGVMAIRGGGYAACERTYQDAALEATQALHAQYIAEMERGNRLASALRQEQRETQRLREQHANHSRLLVGTCPSGVRTLHDAAATGTELSEAAIGALNSTRTVEASSIAEAVTDNYARARDCQNQLNKLIDFIEGQK
jgi:hypothetical protein